MAGSPNQAMALSGQRALITGANSGIGAGIARAYCNAGASVAINFIEDEAAAFALVNELKDIGAQAVAVRADVGDESQVLDMFSTIKEQLGGLDILVNNAGTQRDAPFHNMSLERWQTVINTNLTGQFLCAREATKLFLAQGINKDISSCAGKIICISSVHDVIPWAGHINYAASKGGVTMLMKTMAQELAEHGIRVNGISPGAIRTHINQGVWDDPQRETELKTLIPYDRIGECEDVAKAAVWLASDNADYVVGHNIYIDGGMLLYPGFRTGG